MSISTKSGDKGKTGLWSGERVWKNNERVEAYGTIDELNSFIGEAKHFVETKSIFSQLEEIQNDLFRLAGQLASKDKLFVEPLLDVDVEKLTAWVHAYEKEVILDGFVIPGSTLSSAKLDICRTIARRAERVIIGLQQNEDIPEILIQYINRLSDLLYIMARKEEQLKDKIQKKKWDH
ncbi:MAG: cob(I)yrinic acid a,c-diamide adenosyltransferase [Bacteroidetes bacterium]|nr:cob(I)yrinic acid a,c-diamide adenosyltransferase [Bacteroidota bacterium]